MGTVRAAAMWGTFVIVLSTMTGCEDAVEAPLSERSDSAGVAIVLSSAPQWTEEEEWQLDSLPYLEVSGAGPEYEFDRVADATVLEDGRLVVLDAGTHQVRFFDSEWQFLTRMGQEGEGPGDFQRLTNVSAFRGDSVLVFDYWLRRGSILDETGSLQRVQTFAPELQLQELHPLRDDTLAAVAWSLEEFADVEGPYRGRYLILRTTADGAVLDTVAVIDGWNGYKINREDGGYRDAAPLFILDGHVATNGSAMVMGSGERMEFHRYSLEGTLETVARVPALDEPLTSEEIEAERAAMIRPEGSADYRQLVNALPAPDLRPAYSDLQLDSEGFVWVAKYWSPRRQADDPVLWYVFNPEGAWLGSITTPARFTVLEVGEDYLLGVRRDSLNVERIQGVRLHRPSPG